jgi:hypothetical protein
MVFLVYSESVAIYLGIYFFPVFTNTCVVFVLCYIMNHLATAAVLLMDLFMNAAVLLMWRTHDVAYKYGSIKCTDVPNVVHD